MASTSVTTKTVVVADDTAFVRDRFRTTLEGAGHKVVTVKTAAELLARVRADLSSGFCRDLFNQIVTSGEGIKTAMAAAEDVARKSLAAGDIREICKLNSMDWEGWELPAPDKLEL